MEESELRLRRRSGHALLGIARAYRAGGRSSEARKAYRDFLDAWKHADDDLPQVREAREYLDAGT